MKIFQTQKDGVLLTLAVQYKRNRFYRRLREESERSYEPVQSYTTTSTVVTKTVETYDDINNHEERSEVVMETTEVLTEDLPVVEVCIICIK